MPAMLAASRSSRIGLDADEPMGQLTYWRLHACRFPETLATAP
jgi:hypothetical protein